MIIGADRLALSIDGIGDRIPWQELRLGDRREPIERHLGEPRVVELRAPHAKEARAANTSS